MLDDLDARLARTKWIDELGDDGWKFGLGTPYKRELVRYRRTSFDWLLHENAINRYAQFRVDLDGRHIHFVHERGRGPNALPIILTHRLRIRHADDSRSTRGRPL